MIGFVRRMAALALAAALLFAAGCATAPEHAPRVKRPCPVEVLALAPFQAAEPVEEGRGVICPITAEIHAGLKVPSQAVRMMTASLPAQVEAYFGCKVITPSQLAAKLPPRPTKPGRPVRQAIARAAREAGAQAVLAGTLFRFRERQGSELGVSKPASIYFGLYLLDAQTGRVVWQGFFDETQTSLSENLLRFSTFFSRGAKWLTAEQLGQSGLREVLSRMPGRMPQ